MVMLCYNACIRQSGVWGQLGLPSKFQDSLSHIVMTCWQRLESPKLWDPENQRCKVNKNKTKPNRKGDRIFLRNITIGHITWKFKIIKTNHPLNFQEKTQLWRRMQLTCVLRKMPVHQGKEADDSGFTSLPCELLICYLLLGSTITMSKSVMSKRHYKALRTKEGLPLEDQL